MSDVTAGEAFIRLKLDDQTQESLKRSQAKLLALGDVAVDMDRAISQRTTEAMAAMTAATNVGAQSMSANLNAVTIDAETLHGILEGTQLDNLTIVLQADNRATGVLENVQAQLQLLEAQTLQTNAAIAANTAAVLQQSARAAQSSTQAAVAESEAAASGFSSTFESLVAGLDSVVSFAFANLQRSLAIHLAILETFKPVLQAFFGYLLGEIGAVIALIGTLARAAKAALNSIASIGGIVTSSVSAGVSLAKRAIQSLTTIAASAVRASVAAISAAVRSLASAVGTLVRTTAGALARAAFNPGKYIVEPLTNAFAAAAGKVAGFFGAIQDGLSAIASRMARLGGVFAGIGAAIVVPLTAAAKQFMEAGVAADKLSDKMNMNVVAAQELAHAGNRLDISDETISTAADNARVFVKRANRGEINDEPLKDIGLNTARLADMSTADKFIAIGKAIDATADPLKKAAAAQAIFGKNAKDLEPLFRNNAEQLTRFREEAQALGIVMSAESVSSARALSDAYSLLKLATSGLWRSLGQAVAPAIIETTQLMVGATAAVTRWVKSNPTLIRQIFEIATKVAAVGSVIFSVAAAIGGAASFFGVLAGAAGSVATGITAIGAVVAAVLTPLAILAAAAAGVAIWLGRTAAVQDAASSAVQAGAQAWGSVATAAQGAWGVLVTTLGKIQAFTSQVFGGITKAIMAGDLKLAVQIAWVGAQTAWVAGLTWIANYTGGAMGGIINSLASGDFSTAFTIAWTEIQIAFQRGIGVVQQLWVGLQNTFDMVATFLQQTWNTVLESLASRTVAMVHSLQKMLAGIANSDPTGVLGNKINDLSNAISSGLASSGLQATALSDPQKANAAIDAGLKERQAGRNANLAIQQGNQEKLLQDVRDVLRQMNEDARKGAGDRMAALQQQLAAALEAAAKAKPLFNFSEPGRQASDAWEGFKTKSDSAGAGTFSSAGAMRLSVGFSQSTRLFERIAEATEKTAGKPGITKKDFADTLKLILRLR